MKEMLSNSLFFGMFVSVLGYELGVILKKRFHSALLNPLLFSIIFVMVALSVLNISYSQYESGAKYLSYLLTPATVCLAIPLYQQMNLLKKHWKAVGGGIFSGVIASMGSVLLFSQLFQFTHEQYVTMLPKSITTAIGMGVSEENGGIVTITVAVIIVTGILGNVIAELVFRIFCIEEPIARGVGLGTSAHAIGTAKAMELGEVEGAMSSLSIVVAGLLTVIVMPFFLSVM